MEIGALDESDHVSQGYPASRFRFFFLFGVCVYKAGTREGRMPLTERLLKEGDG